MAKYLKPKYITSTFNINDFSYQDEDADERTITQQSALLSVTDSSQATDITNLQNKLIDWLIYDSGNQLTELQHNLKIDGTSNLNNVILNNLWNQIINSSSVQLGTNSQTVGGGTTTSIGVYANNICAGTGSTAFGHQTLKGNNSFSGTAIGKDCALIYNGSTFTGIGKDCGLYGGTLNLFIGKECGANSTGTSNGSNNVAVGYRALRNLISGTTPFICIGAYAGTQGLGIDSMVNFTGGGNARTCIGNNLTTNIYLHGNPKFKSTTTTVTVSSDSATNVNVFNSNMTTANICGASSTLSIGASTGTCTINNSNVSCNKIVTTLAGTATLASGTVIVNNSNVTSNSLIFLVYLGTPTNIGFLYFSNIIAGTSFQINSTNTSDVNPVSWWLIN